MTACAFETSTVLYTTRLPVRRGVVGESRRITNQMQHPVARRR